MKKLLLLTALLAVMACNKEDEEVDHPKDMIASFHSLVLENNVQKEERRYTFVYDEYGRVSGYYGFSTAIADYSKPSSLVIATDKVNYNFTLSAGKAVKQVHTHFNPSFVFEKIYKYEGDYLAQVESPQTDFVPYNLLKYYWNDGNISKVENISEDGGVITTQLTYDLDSPLNNSRIDLSCFALGGMGIEVGSFNLFGRFTKYLPKKVTVDLGFAVKTVHYTYEKDQLGRLSKVTESEGDTVNIFTISYK